MIKLAIVGTGGMANGHAKAFASIKGAKIVSCADLRADAAAAFAKTHGIPTHYADHMEMMKNEDIDAISNVTPDSAHCSVSLDAIRLGKHVLCEKPLATNANDARRMLEAAKKAKIINMVNFSYRASSALQKASSMVKEGKIGEIRHFEASYLQSWLVSSSRKDWNKNPGSRWRLCSAAGSKGDLGDIGVHILDLTTFVAGPISKIYCNLKTFNKGNGDEFIDGMKMDANDSFSATVELANGALGTIHSSRWATGHSNSLALSIFGTKGALKIDLDKSWGDLQICIGEKNIA